MDGTTTCTAVNELYLNTTKRTMWRCTNSTTDTWEAITSLGTACIETIGSITLLNQTCNDGTYDAEDGDVPVDPLAIDAVVDISSAATSLEAMQWLAASIRPFLATPQTDANRTVIWTGNANLAYADMKSYGTSNLTRKGVLLAPVGALDGNSLPAVDCSRNVTGGTLTILMANFAPGFTSTGQAALSQTFSFSAGDVCGFTTGTVSDATTLGRITSAVTIEGHLIHFGGAAVGTWNDARVASPVAVSGHSTGTHVLFGNFGSTGLNAKNLTVQLNCNGAADNDNIGMALSWAFSSRLPIGNITSCGTGLLIQGGGGYRVETGLYIGANDVGLAYANDLCGAGVCVASDCVSTFCSGSRPDAGLDYEDANGIIIDGATIEGNTWNIVSPGGISVDALYSHGDNTEGNGTICLGCGFNSSTNALCCIDPAGAPTCDSLDVRGFVPDVWIDGYYRGNRVANADLCFGPGAHNPRDDVAQFVIEGTTDGTFTAVTGGTWGNDNCAANDDPWLCCSGAGTGTCGAPTVVAEQLIEAGSGTPNARTKPDNSYCTGAGAPMACCTGAGTGDCNWQGRWIDLDPQTRQGTAFPTAVAVNPGELFMCLDCAVSGSGTSATCDASGSGTNILCVRNAANDAWLPANLGAGDTDEAIVYASTCQPYSGGGNAGDICIDNAGADINRIYRCTGGGCDAAGEWIAIGLGNTIEGSEIADEDIDPTLKLDPAVCANGEALGKAAGVWACIASGGFTPNANPETDHSGFDDQVTRGADLTGEFTIDNFTPTDAGDAGISLREALDGIDAALAGGGSTFLSLTDTPSSYSSQATNMLRVNAGETALEFQTPAQVRANVGADNASNLSSGTLPAERLGADSIDALTEIAQGIKSAANDTGVLMVGTVPGTPDTKLACFDSAGQIVGCDAGAATLDGSGNLTIAGKLIAGGGTVDIDDCTGLAGELFYDTVDARWEFCDAGSGTPTNLLQTAPSDTAFAASWDAVTTIAPSKNAVYDFLHLLDTDDDGKVNVLDQVAGLAKTDASGVLQAPVVPGTGVETFLVTPSGANLAAALTSALPVTDGGTGLASGTSGGVPYFSASTTIASSAALAANALVLGGGAGAAPATTTTGTGVVTALGVNVGSAGAFVTNGGALGTPSGGDLSGMAALNVPIEFCWAISDFNTTDLATGTGKAIEYLGGAGAFTVLQARAYVRTVPTGSGITIDINEAGTTILSTKITIDVSENTGGTSGAQGEAAAAAVLSDTSIALNAQVTVDIDAVGSTNPGKGGVVCLLGHF